MTTIVEKAAGPVTFEIPAADVRPVFADQLALRPSASSPLSKALAGYIAGSAVASEAGRKAATDPLFARAAKALEAPGLRIAHRITGGMQAYALLDVYRSAAVDRDLLVAVPATPDGTVVVQAFESAGAYLDWWLNTFALAVAPSSPNYLPPPLSLESALYLLHTVDCYRRAYYQSMLDYAAAGEPTISTKEFFRTMLSSAKSGDPRWLMPAFLASTPGLPRLNPTDSDLEPLWGLDFLITGKVPATGEDAFVWGEAGTIMGQEFLQSWASSVGWEASLAGPGERSLHRAFLAPTLVANHLFVVEHGPGGATTVNHQVMSPAQLRTRLEALLRRALEAAPEVPSSAFPTSVPEPMVAPAQPVAAPVGVTAPTSPRQAPKVARRFCTSCGAQMVEGDRFCGQCGTVAKS